MRVALLLFAAGCVHYRAGSFADLKSWPGARVTLGCLDVAVDVTRDERVTGPVVAYAFGNRCRSDVTVDLAAVRVIARDARGRELPLAAFDPCHEIRPLALPAALWGSEHIEYNGDFAERELTQVCVDVGAIERGGGEHWVCSGTRLEAAR